MRLLSGLIGHATEVKAEELQKTMDGILVTDEQVEIGYKIIRDMFVFTNKRLILIDKQGKTGKKVSYHSIPYRSIDHFVIETAGHFDLDSELRIHLKGGNTIVKGFNKDTDIKMVQRTLATYTL